MNEVTIVGGGPTGLMSAGELALAGVDVAILERRPAPGLVGTRARGFHSRTIEILDQRGVADRFLAEGRIAQALSFGDTSLNVGGFPSRHPYTLGLAQSHIERILLGWVEQLGVPIRRGIEVIGFAPDDAGVDVHLAEGGPLRTASLVGADGGGSVIRKVAGIDFVGAEATRSHLIAEVEVTAGTPTGIRLDDVGIHAMNVMEDGRTVGLVVTEQQLGPDAEPTLADLRKALTAVYGTEFGIHDPRWISRFTDATRQAAAYRRGRVLLVGDAAHIHPLPAVRASASGCRMRSTSAGNWPRWSGASHPRASWTATRQNGTPTPHVNGDEVDGVRRTHQVCSVAGHAPCGAIPRQPPTRERVSERNWLALLLSGLPKITGTHGLDR
jgi:3-(3-hydroxy-phenyl)propionate hydroxylase